MNMYRYARLAYVLLHLLHLVSGQTPVRIDDTYTFSDSNPGGIQFGGAGWDNYNPGHAASRYNGSMTVTNTPDATIAFFFRGKSIKYYSDRDPKGGSASIRIDGQQSVTVGVRAPPSGFQFQQLLWTSPALDANDHQIVISNVGAKIDPQQGIIGLDFFEIAPIDGSSDVRPSSFGPGASSVPGKAVLVDDSDGTITYSGGGWQTKSSAPDSSIYFKGSAHTTTTPGDSCSFRFIGTDVWYFTDYAPNNAVVEISIDGGAPESINTGAATQTIARTQRMTWGKTGLSDAPHTITIKHAGQPGSSASLDFFRYIPSSGMGATSTSSSSAAGPTSSPDSSTLGSSSSSAPVGAIAGGSVGGFAALAVLGVGALLFFRRRRKNRSRVDGDQLNEKEPASWNSSTSPHPSAMAHGGNGVNSPSYGQYPSAPSSALTPGYFGHPEAHE